MLLNLNLIAGKINPDIITDSKIKNIYEFHIDYPVFMKAAPYFQNSICMWQTISSCQRILDFRDIVLLYYGGKRGGLL